MSQKIKNIICIILLICSLMTNFFLISKKDSSKTNKNTLPNNTIFGYNEVSDPSIIKNNGYTPNPDYYLELKKQINDSTTITYLTGKYQLKNGKIKSIVEKKIVTIEFEKFDIDNLQQFIEKNGGLIEAPLYPNENEVYLFGITDENYLSYFGKYGNLQGKGVFDITYYVPYSNEGIDPQ